MNIIQVTMNKVQIMETTDYMYIYYTMLNCQFTVIKLKKINIMCKFLRKHISLFDQKQT